jgi:serine phosphatase RsbU (regulator of sigma subunit)
VGEVEGDGHLFYVNAGHPGPILVSGNDTQFLKATGITLGFMPKIKMNRGYVHLENQSVLLLCSDGAIERMNAGEEQFGVERLKDVLIKSQFRSAKDIVDSIFKTLYEYGNRTAWEDDTTVVVIKRK